MFPRMPERSLHGIVMLVSIWRMPMFFHTVESYVNRLKYEYVRAQLRAVMESEDVPNTACDIDWEEWITS